jgi:hypothetical protein
LATVFKSKVRYNHAGFCCALRIQEETVFGIEGYSSETVVALLAGGTLVISWVFVQVAFALYYARRRRGRF